MSAVPKKKLCWNCEGNVSRELDNCPYCGVYLHALETQDDSNWNPTYTKTEDIQSLLSSSQTTVESPYESRPSFALIFSRLKKDVFPLLFLMVGSIFLLFGVVLILFSENGALTLQWQSKNGVYFLFFAVPLIILGWKFLQELNQDNHPE